MLSRVADAVYWMARYIERTDNILRVLRTHYIASQDEILDFQWERYIAHMAPESALRTQIRNYREALHFLLLHKENDASVFVNVVRARENARSVQDYITKELWQTLNDYYHIVRDESTAETLREGDPVSAMDLLLRQSTLFYGTIDTTMYRGEGYTFLNIGKYLERTLQTLDIVQMTVADVQRTGHETIHWKYLLYSLSGYEYHSKFYKNATQLRELTDQVFFATRFPHSILYSVGQLERYFLRLEDASQPLAFRDISFRIGKVVNELRYHHRPVDNMEQVEQLIGSVRGQIGDIGYEVARQYFGYS